MTKIPFFYTLSKIRIIHFILKFSYRLNMYWDRHRRFISWSNVVHHGIRIYKYLDVCLCAWVGPSPFSCRYSRQRGFPQQAICNMSESKLGGFDPCLQIYLTCFSGLLVVHWDTLISMVLGNARTCCTTGLSLYTHNVLYHDMLEDFTAMVLTTMVLTPGTDNVILGLFGEEQI